MNPPPNLGFRPALRAIGGRNAGRYAKFAISSVAQLGIVASVPGESSPDDGRNAKFGAERSAELGVSAGILLGFRADDGHYPKLGMALTAPTRGPDMRKCLRRHSASLQRMGLRMASCSMAPIPPPPQVPQTHAPSRQTGTLQTFRYLMTLGRHLMALEDIETSPVMRHGGSIVHVRSKFR